MDNSYQIVDDEPDDDREYTDRELAIRHKFIEHYLHDYDPVAAAQRCGWPREYAKDMSMKFMDEPYVMNEIKKRETKPPVIDLENNPEAAKAQEAQMRQYVLAGLIKQANYYGPGSTHSGRVAALAEISKLQGLNAPARLKQEITTGENEGVFVVPGVVSQDEWARMAAEHQGKLSEEVANSSTKH